MKRQILLYLQEIGWSELIDNRWKDEVIQDIVYQFPNIEEKELNEILNLILV